MQEPQETRKRDAPSKGMERGWRGALQGCGAPPFRWENEWIFQLVLVFVVRSLMLTAKFSQCWYIVFFHTWECYSIGFLHLFLWASSLLLVYWFYLCVQIILKISPWYWSFLNVTGVGPIFTYLARFLAYIFNLKTSNFIQFYKVSAAISW